MKNLVQISGANGKVVTTSLKVAEVFKRRHSDVLKAIRNLECSEEFHRNNYLLTSYKDSQSKERPMYEITSVGFEILPIKYTGPRGSKFSQVYFDYMGAFHQMNDQLRQSPEPPKTGLELLLDMFLESIKHQMELERKSKQG